VIKPRNVIVHYHIFKNAGSSVDQLLRENFSADWLSYDTDDSGGVITTSALSDLINSNPQYQAFSSHQIVPPLPEVDGYIYPIVFVRDPIDRIRSAYLFEWQKQLGLESPKGSLREYVESKFVSRRKNAIEEFQTLRLSNTDPNDHQVFDAVEDDELYHRAISFIRSLDFVGIVDQFDESCVLLQRYLQSAFPEFQIKKVQANVLQDISMSIKAKRDLIRTELGDDLYEEVLERNILDDQLYRETCVHFETLYSSHDYLLGEVV